MDSVKTVGREPTPGVPGAAVAHRQINGEAGGAIVFCVVLADGFIVECGAGGLGNARANAIAEAINQYGAHRLDYR